MIDEKLCEERVKFLQGKMENIESRVTSLEDDSKNNNSLIISVEKLAMEIKHMREDYQKSEELHSKEIKGISERLSEIENKPTKRYEQVVSIVITSLVTAVLGFFIGKIGL